MQAPASTITHSASTEDLIPVGVYPSMRAGEVRGLVILATGNAYWLVPEADGFHLMVERGAEEVARHHLAAFERESLRWPPRAAADSWTPRPFDWMAPLLWAILVLGVYRLTVRYPEWEAVGLLEPKSLFYEGQWWRPFTALFLHGSPAHVISNALSGLLVFPAVLSTFGRWRGWALVFLAAALGNIAVAAVHLGESYSSLGASTAIFAGVGLLTGRAVGVMSGAPRKWRWRAMLTPLAAGLAVLALYGAGEERVDVAAHLSGFGAGLLIGAAALAGLNRRHKDGVTANSR